MQAQIQKAKIEGAAKMVANIADFKTQLVNDQNLAKNRKKRSKSPKKITATQIATIKDKLTKKGESIKLKQEIFEMKQNAQKHQKVKQDTNKAKLNIKPQSTPVTIKRPRNDLNTEKDKKPQPKPKQEKPIDATKLKVIEKQLEVIKAEKPHTAPSAKRSSPQNTIAKKDKNNLKQEMKTKIEKISDSPFVAKKLDEETVASIRKALSVLVDKALDTLQKVPREKLKAASIHLQKKDVKLKSRAKSPPYGDPTAQLQAKLKENVIKQFEKVGADIVGRSKNM